CAYDKPRIARCFQDRGDLARRAPVPLTAGPAIAPWLHLRHGTCETSAGVRPWRGAPDGWQGSPVGTRETGHERPGYSGHVQESPSPDPTGRPAPDAAGPRRSSVPGRAGLLPEPPRRAGPRLLPVTWSPAVWRPRDGDCRTSRNGRIMHDCQTSAVMPDRVRPEMPPHALPAEVVLQSLAADATRGLTSVQVAEARARHGFNELAEAARAGPWQRVLGQFRELVIWILIVAAVLSAATGEWADALAILAIVLLNALLGAFQEERAERALAALQKLSAPLARVVRDGVP